ncbi:uncharacterized protein LOC108907214 [Anoplophora glabripennis]|uniref:uncharacterized protein LOC108907214 n=1 Tax=Anoplophora glabripennis TaxID=217634 RepID=UPI0008759E85|nr:uncharacterized protein LOC108907214 [Anoplophora glabripennis]
MRWHASLVVLLALGSVTVISGFRSALKFPENYIEDLPLEEANIDERPVHLNMYDDEKLEKIDSILTSLLISPWPHGISPILYVENNPVSVEDELLSDTPTPDESLHPVPPKRTRYYRKYPWKRQNSRYEPGNRFICTPSKDDVYRLLVALHEARQGNRDRMVNFCNRKRPAYAIYTNIRFLGK